MKIMVEMESPSSDIQSLREMSALLVFMNRDRTGTTFETIELDGAGPAVIVNRLAKGVLLVCHYDTVHPAGTIKQFPLSIDENIISGTGIYDMKEGIAMSIWALKFLKENSPYPPPVIILIAPDEEAGSLNSSELIGKLAALPRCL